MNVQIHANVLLFCFRGADFCRPQNFLTFLKENFLSISDWQNEHLEGSEI